MRSTDLFYWIKERHAIYEARRNKLPKPWTQDTIFQNYRFCNVYRELDKVTLWINKHWRTPHKDDQDLWFAMVVARLVNWPDTMEEMRFVAGLNEEQFVGTIHRRQQAGKKAYSGAYIVSTNGNSMDKADYLFQKVLTPLWSKREYLRPVQGELLESFYTRLTTSIGLGTFMAAQVVADMKYAPVLRKAKDWDTFAAPGPGSKRGLNRVFDKPIDSPWGSRWHQHLMMLKKEIDVMIKAAGMPSLHAQDLQNCLCEFDKMERVRLGQGTPRSGFPGR